MEAKLFQQVSKNHNQQNLQKYTLYQQIHNIYRNIYKYYIIIIIQNKCRSFKINKIRFDMFLHETKESGRKKVSFCPVNQDIKRCADSTMSR